MLNYKVTEYVKIYFFCIIIFLKKCLKMDKNYVIAGFIAQNDCRGSPLVKVTVKELDQWCSENTKQH